MLDNYTLLGAMLAIISAIIMGPLPLIKPPPKYPIDAIADASRFRIGGSGEEMSKVFNRLNDQFNESRAFQRRCVVLGILVLALGVILSLLGAADG